MKKLTTFLGITIFSLSLFACSQKDDNAQPEAPQENNIITLTAEIDFSENMPKGPSSAFSDEGLINTTTRPKVVSVRYDLGKEELVSWLVEDDTYLIVEQQTGYTRSEVNAIIDSNIQKMESGYYASQSDFGGFALPRCISDCYDRYTGADGVKKPGRGSCKAACYIEWFKKEVWDPIFQPRKVATELFTDPFCRF